MSSESMGRLDRRAFLGRVSALGLAVAALGLSLSPMGAMAQIAGSGEGFHERIMRTTAELIEEASKDAAIQKGDISRARALIEAKLLPLINQPRMGQVALAGVWRQASEAQRSELSGLVSKLLVKSYARALLEVKGAKLELMPARMDAATGEGKAKGKLARPGREPMALAFSLLAKDGQAGVFDIEVEGVSLMSSMREGLRAIAQQKGVDGLIAELREKTK